MPRRFNGSLREARPSHGTQSPAIQPTNTPAETYFSLLITILGVALALLVTINPLVNVDLWFHLKAGELIAGSHSIPTQDPFSFTARGNPWIVNSWLSELIFWETYRLLGANGLILLGSALVLACFGLLRALWRRLGGDPVLGAGILCIALLAGVFRYTPRAELFTALLTAAMLFVLYQIKARREFPTRLLPVLPLIMLLWPNLHMGFLNGVAVLGIFVVGEVLLVWLSPRYPGKLEPPLPMPALKRLVGVSLLSVLATLANPYGFGAWHYTSLVAGTPIFRREIEEWLPLLSRSTPVCPACLWCLAGLAIAFVASAYLRRRIDISGFLLTGFAFITMLLFRRQAILFILVSAAAMAYQWRQCSDQATTPLDEPEVRRRLPLLIGAGQAAVLVLLLCFGMGSRLPRSHILRLGMESRTTPIGAADFIAKNVPSGNLFNSMEIGGYLLWRLYPEHRVFIDGRVDMYGSEIFKLYDALTYEGRDWRSDFQQMGIDTCVLSYPSSGEPYSRHLSGRLSVDPEWRLVYWDDVAMIFLRNNAANSATISRYEYRYLNPISARALNRAIREGRFPQILAEIRRVLRERPNEITSHIMAASAYQAMEMSTEAKKEARVVEQMDVDHLYIGGSSGGTQRVVHAGAINLAQIEAEQGVSCSREGRFKEAIPHLQKAVAGMPKNGEVHFHLAFALSQTGGLKEAEREYGIAERLDPKNPSIRYNQACLLAKMGQTKDALRDLEEALKMLPSLKDDAKADPDLESLRSNPRFGALMASSSGGR